MVPGFELMATLPGTRAIAFTVAFPDCEWKSSTYYDHVGSYNRAPADVLAVAVNLGREVGGEWAPLAQKYSKKNQTC